MAGPSRPKERCVFCGRGYDQVERLVAGPPDVYICNECVDLCKSILDQDAQRSGGTERPGTGRATKGG